MTLKIPIFVLVCIFVTLPIALTATCPSMEDVTPCICDGYYEEIKCHGIDNEELVRVASNLRGKNDYSFIIENSTLDSIPHDVFKGVKLSQLKFENSTLVALTDRSEAFFGLEEHLEKLRIWNCVIKNEWDWSVLRNLKKLKSLSIHGTLNLETIGTDVMKASVSSVDAFTFSDTNITFTDHAFDSYENIKRLDLSYNKIRDVKRTILPNPALQLISFDLSNNLIKQLPEDMFDNMPSLTFLYIGDNNIQVLDRNTLSPIWGQLISFYTFGNPHRCDCSIQWILRSKSPLYGSEARCSSPPHLRGTKLTELVSGDFFMC